MDAGVAAGRRRLAGHQVVLLNHGWYAARAPQLSRGSDTQVIRVPDQRFGEVNSYHETILYKVFEDLL